MAANPTIHRIIIGTAGHIDHGKSSLVRALTGIDPDRLPEEKERGLTIDLGFAPLKLRDGTHIGIVDVPGHERFIKNMVAGATSIDFVIFVIAADDSVMPQTREHLEIMQLLGVTRGLVALTKIDLVEATQVEMVQEEIRELLHGSFLENAPIFPVAPTQGLGMEPFQKELEKLVRETPAHSPEGVFRMPIQRVFSAQGFGTVVTGIPISGRIEIGARVEILPLGRIGKVRGIHAYKQSMDSASSGHSTALNLSDLDYREVHRGMVAAEPGYFQARKIVEAKLKLLAREKKPLLDQTAIRLHVGTTEALGKVAFLDRKALSPGDEAFVQLKLDDAVVVAPGDRFILRLETPPMTVGGGTIVGESGRRLKRFQKETIEDLQRSEQSLGDRLQHLSYALERKAEKSSSVKDLVAETKLPRVELLRSLKSLEEKKQTRSLKGDEIWIHESGWVKARRQLEQAIQDYFQKNPSRLVLERIALRESVHLEEAVLDALLSQRETAASWSYESGKIRLAQAQAKLAPELEQRKQQLQKILIQSKCAPPELPLLSQQLGRPEKEIVVLLTSLVDEGAAIRSAGIYFSKEAAEMAKAAIVENIRKHGELDIPSLRDRLDTSRKYLIPLLEYFDSTGLTLRQGPRRILRR